MKIKTNDIILTLEETLYEENTHMELDQIIREFNERKKQKKKSWKILKELYLK